MSMTSLNHSSILPQNICRSRSKILVLCTDKLSLTSSDWLQYLEAAWRMELGICSKISKNFPEQHVGTFVAHTGSSFASFLAFLEISDFNLLFEKHVGLLFRSIFIKGLLYWCTTRRLNQVKSKA